MIGLIKREDYIFEEEYQEALEEWLKMLELHNSSYIIDPQNKNNECDDEIH